MSRLLECLKAGAHDVELALRWVAQSLLCQREGETETACHLPRMRALAEETVSRGLDSVSTTSFHCRNQLVPHLSLPTAPSGFIDI